MQSATQSTQLCNTVLVGWMQGKRRQREAVDSAEGPSDLAQVRDEDAVEPVRKARKATLGASNGRAR